MTYTPQSITKIRRLDRMKQRARFAKDPHIEMQKMVYEEVRFQTKQSSLNAHRSQLLCREQNDLIRELIDLIKEKT